MKKATTNTCILAFLILSLLLPFRGQTQGYTSNSTHSYNSVNPTDKTIVRRWKNKALITVSHHDRGYRSHTFQLRSLNASTASVVSLVRTMNIYGPIEDYINDMRISGDRCYFCGTRVSIERQGYVIDLHGNEQWQVVYDTCAIMGYFDFDTNLIADNNVYIYKIDKAKSAQRMLVYQPENTNLTAVELLCLHDTTGYGPTCLVEMINQPADPHDWEYNLVTPQNQDEILTDVVQNEWAIITSSIFSDNASDIGFRAAKKASTHAFSVQGGMGDYLYKYNIGEYDTNCNSYGFRRLNGAKVRLCSRIDGFTAAVAATVNHDRDSFMVYVEDPILLFDMYSPDVMLEYQVVRAGKRLTLKDMAYIKPAGSLGLLYSFSLPNPLLDTVKTYLQFPKFGVVPVCNSYSDTLLYYRDGQMQTIDPLGTNSVCVGGYKNEGSSPFDGTQLRTNRLNSCLQFGGVGNIFRRPKLKYQIIESPMEAIIIKKDVDRVNPQTISTQTATTAYCEF